MALTSAELARIIGCEIKGDPGQIFSGINSLDEAEPGEVSFLGNLRYAPQLPATRAGLVLVPGGDFSSPDGCLLVEVENPSASFSKVIDHFQKEASAMEPGVAAGAMVADGVDFDPAAVVVAAGAVIGKGASIGSGTVIGAGAVIGRNVQIGKDCVIHMNASVRERCVLGERVILQPNAVIGSDGFGFELVDGRQQKVPQVGIVILEDDVEIGSNSCIDRARFGSTVIGEGTKIDNLVQIAHNVKIGKHCLIVSQSGVAGSSKLGDHVTIAAQAGVAGHLEIGDHVVLAGRAGATKSIASPGAYMGMPARPMVKEQRKMASLARVPKLLAEVRSLKKKLEKLTDE